MSCGWASDEPRQVVRELLLPPVGLAALQLVMAQPSISSQTIDNLNASIHVRALLTDLFLIDEILKDRSRNATPNSQLPTPK